jgi:methionyl-tRNA synthetase
LSGALRDFVASRSWKPNVGPVIESWLRQGLAPRAITRDLDWGVPVPNLPGKVLYVWFEAPLGYISITQKWAQANNTPDAWIPFWKDPETRIVHFIGKDNIVFHTLIFPAILIAADEGYNLPFAVPAHEFLNLEGQKISTSRRWTIDLNDYLEKAPHRVDELRFVLTALLPQTKDRDFTWQEYEQRIHTELLANLSNLLHRLLSLLWRQGQRHAVRPMPTLLRARAETAREMAQRLEAFDFTGALESLLALGRLANKALTEAAPWHQPPEKAAEILLGFTDLLLALGTLMEPFLPVRIAPQLRALLQAPLYPWDALEKPEPLARELLLTQPPQPLVPKLSPQELTSLKSLLPQTTPTPSTQTPAIPIEEFQKIRLKVVSILQAERIPKADKLLKLRILSDDGEHTVVSGVAAHYAPEALIGKQAVWVSNLPKKTLRGVESEGMLLFAEDASGRLILISPLELCTPGSPVK